jgi:hypothetical protein
VRVGVVASVRTSPPCPLAVLIPRPNRLCQSRPPQADEEAGCPTTTTGRLTEHRSRHARPLSFVKKVTNPAREKGGANRTIPVNFVPYLVGDSAANPARGPTPTYIVQDFTGSAKRSCRI